MSQHIRIIPQIDDIPIVRSVLPQEELPYIVDHVFQNMVLYHRISGFSSHYGPIIRRFGGCHLKGQRNGDIRFI